MLDRCSRRCARAGLAMLRAVILLHRYVGYVLDVVGEPCCQRLHVQLSASPANVLIDKLAAAADEMWSVVQQKANKQWLWLAREQTTSVPSNSSFATTTWRKRQHYLCSTTDA